MHGCKRLGDAKMTAGTRNVNSPAISMGYGWHDQTGWL